MVSVTNPLHAPLLHKSFSTQIKFCSQQYLVCIQVYLTFSAVILFPSRAYDTIEINTTMFVENFPNDKSKPRTKNAALTV
jgi:hypothetical protein